MGVKLVKQAERGCSLDDMLDGQIGIITRFLGQPEQLGKIVQRVGPRLIVLGSGYGKHWSSIFDSHHGSRIMVDILPPGTTIEITED